MQEKSLFKISFIIVTLGLVFLFFYSSNLNLNAIESIETAIVEETVKINGVISRISNHENVVFLVVEGQKTETMEIVVFNENLYLKQGDQVEITGQIEEYKGKKEIIASSVALK
jgi:DNA/RNA endonuclease YhcR with UshA esterase domain